VGTVVAVRFQNGPLTERDDSARKGLGSVDAYERLSADFAGRGDSEQRMTVCDTLDVNLRHAGHDPLDKSRLDTLDSVPVRAEAAIPDGQSDCDEVDAEDCGPAGGYDIQKAFDRRRFDRFEDGGVDRGHRVGMASRERNEVLVRFLGFSEAFAKASDRLLLELNHLPHQPPR
jgi:hypothetical protein